ncbi:hypothetical protein QYE76_008611 [Lolium multiflorum]|uniref:Ty3 transposon capsid-like protein domain-containing protein n=1 Tax=Lolium multiflorum TaxID=4521 RepID=A0AAD8TTL1_LOLMU|nr:hypothetical protein QYE76_008611 [Lolium multiflorum]
MSLPKASGSETTEQLEMKSLQLEITAIQQNRENDKKEFSDFASATNKNFVDIQANFDLMQKNFEILFAATKGKSDQPPPLAPHVDAQGEVVTTPEHGSVKQPVQPVKPIGTSRLQDIYGRELQLDGALKQPYKHPNATGKVVQGNRTTNAENQVNIGDDDSDSEGKRVQPRFRTYGQTELRRMNPVCKPAKLNIPEFDGDDVDSWIQIIEQYFDSARTQLDQRTEIAITYLKGPAIQWWRGTGYSSTNVPWHRFCRYLSDRFATTSICDNVRAFHSLTQTSTVDNYILKFERAMNLMRRDSPTLPNDSYVNSFISGLTPYIQNHLQCHKPTDMQEAIWYARRMERAAPSPVPTSKQYYPSARRQVTFDQPKALATNSTTAAIIQEAREKKVCYKCREPWFPGHKRVCKMSQQAQVNALQVQATEKEEIIYIHEYDDDDSDDPDDTAEPMSVSMHALKGTKARKYTFTLYLTVGTEKAIALVDSGSTTTFMTPELAMKAQCNLTPTKKEHVQVANGETLWTEFLCKGTKYEIQGVPFESDFRLLKLKGYDIILGADWIYEHSPVELNLKAL